MSKIYQFSTIGALMSGYFYPDQDVSEVCSCSSIGLGCSEKLNAELTISDGKLYTATAEKSLESHTSALFVPFYQVTNFNNYKQYQILETTQDTLEQTIKHIILLKNNFVAVKIKAHFTNLVLRRPYASDKMRNIEDVSNNQLVSQYKDISGCLIGFWTPELFGRISVPGFHLHFLSDDLMISGHVLSYHFDSAELQIEEKRTIEIMNPNRSEFAELDINLQLLDGLISKVEK
ncbi:acetolactate decarboxylase [Acinetobacter nectaris]|uniref:acetolactate decarboxylase n=1 Tax=Acinetobacter nectaris TaxID=1219382 RepID=UPI001F24D1A7|nr:acetolactate decarboxylase [Acinetobacter nectaris]MCF8999170.1 acetolactate decarboxylase [Acinetobacter nectaris]MCF9026505.1 acetolactate decarboxylase [Acinetobacter nectaris]